MELFFRAIREALRLPSVRLSRAEDRLGLALLTGIVLTVFSYACILGNRDYLFPYHASRLFMHRLDPYQVSAYHAIHYDLGFPYPPLALLLNVGPSAFAFGTAVMLWHLGGLFCYMAALYLWVDLAWDRGDIAFHRFCLVAAAATLAPVLWAFCLNQMALPALLFISLGVWAAVKKGSAWQSGFWVGLALLKPHLMFLAFLALLWRVRPRLKFLLGAGLGMLLPLSPFLCGYRPARDLRGWVLSARLHSLHSYSLDEQGLAYRLYPLVRAPADGKELERLEQDMGDSISLFASAPVLQGLRRVKLAVLVLGLAAWLWAGPRVRPISRLTALSLAWAVMISPYTHFYDGVVLVPWLILLLRDLSREFSLAALAAALVLFNAGMVLAISPGRISWGCLACASAFLAGEYALRRRRMARGQACGSATR